jgi:hypothetical protein
MNFKPINPDTIWNDTYRETRIVESDNTNANVFSAIHKSAGPILRLEIELYGDIITSKHHVKLTPEQAEAMAAELLNAAQLKREYDAAWANHRAAQLPEAA